MATLTQLATSNLALKGAGDEYNYINRFFATKAEADAALADGSWAPEAGKLNACLTGDQGLLVYNEGTSSLDLADEATRAYIDAQIAALVDSSPETLNTLNELAAALGDDPDYFTNAEAARQANTNLINAETSRATAAENAIQADVDQNEADADAAIAAVQADVDANETATATAIAAVQADVDQNEADADAAIAAVQADVDQNELDSDAADVALGVRIDAVEAEIDTARTNIYAALGRAEGVQAMGTFTGSTLTDNTTVRALFQELETATELRATIAAPTFTGDVTLGNGAFYDESSERMGFGTSTPGGRLHVYDTGGVQAIFQRTGGSSTLTVKNNSADDGITLQSTTQSANALKFEGYGTGAGVRFVTNNAGTYSDRLLVQHDNVTAEVTLNANSGFQIGGVDVTATAAELNYVDGVTSNVQTQLDAIQADVDSNESDADAAIALKADIDSPTFTGTPAAPTAGAGTNTTQIATTAYVETAVANLVASAPGTLDTLNELAAAMGDDANFAATVAADIAAVQADVDQNELDGDNADAALSGRLDTLEVDPTTQTAVDAKLDASAVSTFGGTLIDDADAAAARTTLGLGTAATTDASAYATAAQGATADAALPASSVSAFGGTLIDDADSTAARATLGLSNVDNTSDANKPVSTATQTALDLKANLASPDLTGTPTAPTASADTNTTQIATTAYVQAELAAFVAADISDVTATAAELNLLDGVTASTAELNILDGVTATAAELNTLDGVTASTAELNLLDGVTSTTAELNILDGVTANATELNILDGVTATTAEVNVLDGVTATTAEINYVDVAAAGTAEASKAMVLDAGKSISGINQLTCIDLTVQGTTTTVDTVTMQATNAIAFEGATADSNETTLTIIDPDADRTIKLPNQSGCLPILAADSNTQITATPEELNYSDGVTSNIQTQLDARPLLDGSNIPGPYNNDSDAGTAGVAVGAIYKNSNGTIHWRVS